MVKGNNITCKLFTKSMSCIVLVLLYFNTAAIKVRAQEKLSSNEKIEILLKDIAQLSTDSLKIDRYIEEGWGYHTSEVTTSNLLADKAEALSEATNNKMGIAKAKSLKAVCESIKGAVRISNAYNEEAIKIALELNDSILISRIYNCMAINYAKESVTYEKAYDYYKKTLEYNSNDTIGYINTHANLSTLFEQMDLVDNQIQAIKEVINTTNNLKKSRYKEINLGFRIDLLLIQGDTIQASKLLDELINKNIEEKKNYRLIFNYLDKSEILQSQKKYEAALQLIEAGNIVVEKYGFVQEADAVNHQKALLYIDIKDYSNAIKYLNKINKTKSTYIDAVEKLCEVYEKNGDYESALVYAKKFKTLNDSLNNLEATTKIAELEKMYNLEKQEKENQSLKLKSVKIENQLRNRNLLLEYLLAGLGIMVLLALFFYNQNLQRKKYNDLLYTEVDQKTQSLKIANEQLTASNKELEAFTYVAAHDLMTPLRSITSFTGLIKKKNIDNLDKNTREYFSHIEKSSKWMSDLIEDLLVFTKLEKDSYQYEEIKISTLMDEIKSHLKSQINEKNAKIKINYNEEHITGDIKKIKQVFQNLLSNSLKYSKVNTPPIIEITIDKKENWTDFIISDNGIGVDEKYYKVIFEPFKRLHSKDEIEGTGIGLYICKKIITKIGGNISLSSSPEGTTFNFTLPNKPHIE
jgi:signal transduction histidine kinase